MNPKSYNGISLTIRQTNVYARWFGRLRDKEAKLRIESRIRRIAFGNPGDVKSIGEGVTEIRINYGPGYRVYFLRWGKTLIVLIAGGDKDSQRRDIPRALNLAREIRKLLEH